MPMGVVQGPLALVLRALCLSVLVPLTASANNSSVVSSSVDLYFGVGCFWHIQHEVIQAERRILGRGDDKITGLTGYAGGTGPNAGGHVCYPPKSSDGDLGHAEVVGFNTPKAEIAPFAQAFWKLFVGMDRVDTQDKGRDYRAVLGLPGGTQSEWLPTFQNAQGSQKFELREGKGGDADTLGLPLVWVYDTAKFPFYQAEAYHQFHDDFQGPQYPQSYNDLRDELLAVCRLKPTHCQGDEKAKSRAPKDCNATGSGAARVNVANPVSVFVVVAFFAHLA